MSYLHGRREILQIIKWLHWGCISAFVLLSGVLPNTSKYFLVLAAAITFYLFFYNTGSYQERFRRIDSQTKNLVLAYFVFLLSIIPSIFLVKNYWPGVKLWFTFALYLTAFIIGRFSGIAESKKSERVLLYMLSFSLFIFSANVIIRFLFWVFHPGGFGLDCGASTSYIAVLTIILWTLGFEFPALGRIGRTICLVISTIGAVALTLSLSRGPWLATILVLIIYMVINLKRDWKRPVGTFLLILVMFTILFIPTSTIDLNTFILNSTKTPKSSSVPTITETINPNTLTPNLTETHKNSSVPTETINPNTLIPNSTEVPKSSGVPTKAMLSERFNIDWSMVSKKSSTQSIAERLRTWKAAINMFIDHPLLGIGLCHFQNSYKTIYAPAGAIRRDLPQAHNNFLQFLSETGIVGISGFLIMTGYLLLSLSRLTLYKRPNYWLVAALLMTLSEVFFHGMTDYTFYLSPVARICWFVLGVAYAQGSQTPRVEKN